MTLLNATSACGLLVLILIAWIFSVHRRCLNWRVIGFGLALQITLGCLLFTVPAGAKVFSLVNDGVITILDSAGEGARFVFGPLALPPGQSDADGNLSPGFILAFQAFPTIIFFSALIAILYHVGIMPLVLRGFAYIFTKLMRISGAESLVAASNIFVGIESTLTIKPYLSKLTSSELCTILCAGMATVSSNVLALYVFSLQEQFPQIAGHLVSASLLSAPAALVMSKILLPETDTPGTLGLHVQPNYEKEGTLFETVIKASHSAVKMIVGISALLIAVIGLVALVDVLLNALGSRINPLIHLEGTWSLKGICGFIFYPVTLLLGVPFSEAMTVSRIIGERLVVTEVVAYQDLNATMAQSQLSMRSAVITTYALCGFAHVASMSIFVGGICALAPDKTRQVSQVALRALFAATLACLMTACIAGMFYTDQSILFGGH